MMNSAPSQTPAVANVLERLNKAIAELEGTLKALDERLTPALRQVPQTPPGHSDNSMPAIAVPSDDSPLVNTLRARLEEVETMQRRVAYLITRLQL